ncbi:polysaccharide lyase family 7 protein [Pseudomonas aeruginosa]
MITTQQLNNGYQSRYFQQGNDGGLVFWGPSTARTPRTAPSSHRTARNPGRRQPRQLVLLAGRQRTAGDHERREGPLKNKVIIGQIHSKSPQTDDDEPLVKLQYYYKPEEGLGRVEALVRNHPDDSYSRNVSILEQVRLGERFNEPARHLQRRVGGARTQPGRRRGRLLPDPRQRLERPVALFQGRRLRERQRRRQRRRQPRDHLPPEHRPSLNRRRRTDAPPQPCASPRRLPPRRARPTPWLSLQPLYAALSTTWQRACYVLLTVANGGYPSPDKDVARLSFPAEARGVFVVSPQRRGRVGGPLSDAHLVAMQLPPGGRSARFRWIRGVR